MDVELRTHLEAMEQRLDGRIEAAETKLLRAFYDWSRPVEIRLRYLSQVEERLGLLEERISKIERGERPPNGS
jgi:hypothetical protein